jgi:hypothetical protein
MSSRAWGAAVFAVVGTLAFAAPAAAETVSALGNGLVQVKPADPKDNDSIKQAIADARATVLPLALADARVRAQQLADGSGLVLGDVESIEEYQDPRFSDYGPSSSGTFAPGEFCGTITRTVRRRTSSGKLVRRRVKQKRCFFPDFLTASVEVTYQASRK